MTKGCARHDKVLSRANVIYLTYPCACGCQDQPYAQNMLYQGKRYCCLESFCTKASMHMQTVSKALGKVRGTPQKAKPKGKVGSRRQGQTCKISLLGLLNGKLLLEASHRLLQHLT